MIDGNYIAKQGAVTVMRWHKHAEHPKVRAPMGAAPGAYSFSVVETPDGARPIEPGDWLVIDEAGNAAPWRNEHFVQVFAASVNRTSPVAAVGTASIPDAADADPFA